MMMKPATAMAVLAVASQAVAERVHVMSSREVLGLLRRDDGTGYTPTQTFCGLGSTCREACGAGFETCASNDSSIHCYNPTVQQVCCPDASGNSCDVGFYCAGAPNGDTICCDQTKSLDDCAKANKVAGALSSQVPKPTSSSTSSSSSSAVYPASNTTVVHSTGFTTTECTSTLGPSATYPAANTTKPGSATTPPTVPVAGASIAGPAGAVMALAAAAFALLL